MFCKWNERHMGMTDGISLGKRSVGANTFQAQHESHTFDQRVYDVDIRS